MKVNLFSRCSLALLSVLTAAMGVFSAGADVQIDDFLSGTGSNELMTATPGATISRQFTGLAGTLGSTRDVVFTNFASEQDATLFFLNSPNLIGGRPVAAGINNGSQLFNDEWSRALFTWDNDGSGLNLNLSGEDTLILEWQPDHLANARNTVVSVSLLDGFGGSHTESVIFSSPQLNPGFLETEFALSNFAGNGVNLANIDSASLAVETDIAGDYTFVEFRAIPEPSSALLLVIGGVAFLLRRPTRRRVG